MMTEPKIGKVFLQVKEGQEFPTATRCQKEARKDSCLYSGGNVACQHLDFQLSASRRKIPVVLSHPIYSYLLRSPRKLTYLISTLMANSISLLTYISRIFHYSPLKPRESNDQVSYLAFCFNFCPSPVYT